MALARSRLRSVATGRIAVEIEARCALLRESADGAAIGRAVLTLVTRTATSVTSATVIGAQPSLVQRGSSRVGAWVAQATSP